MVSQHGLGPGGRDLRPHQPARLRRRGGVRGERKIYEIARDQSDDRPFLLAVSFTHPHDPFAITEPYWDLPRRRLGPDAGPGS
jgi:hypothetical protein